MVDGVIVPPRPCRILTGCRLRSTSSSRPPPTPSWWDFTPVSRQKVGKSSLRLQSTSRRRCYHRTTRDSEFVSKSVFSHLLIITGSDFAWQHISGKPRPFEVVSTCDLSTCHVSPLLLPPVDCLPVEAAELHLWLQAGLSSLPHERI